MSLDQMSIHPRISYQSLRCKIALITIIYSTEATIKKVFFIIGVDIQKRYHTSLIFLTKNTEGRVKFKFQLNKTIMPVKSERATLIAELENLLRHMIIEGVDKKMI
jgi:hypothetical protein